MKKHIEQLIRPSIPTSILMLVGCLVLWVPDFLADKAPMLCWGLLVPHRWVCAMSLLLTIAGGVGLSMLFFYMYLTRMRSVFVAYIYILTVSCMPALHDDVKAQITLLLYLFFVGSLVSMYKNPKAVMQSYNIGLLTALLVMLHPAFLFLLPFCWLGMGFLRAFSLRTFAASLLGLLTVYVLVWWGCYFAQAEAWIPWDGLYFSWSDDVCDICLWLLLNVFLLGFMVSQFLNLLSCSIKHRTVMAAMSILGVGLLILSLCTSLHSSYVICCVVTWLFFFVQWMYSEVSSRMAWVNVALFITILLTIYLVGQFNYGVA